MNIVDSSPSKISYEIGAAQEGVLTPALGIGFVARLQLGAATGLGLPFEKIANPEYAWRVTRDLEAHSITARNFSREDRVLVRMTSATDGRHVVVSCKGQWSVWSPDWQYQNAFQMPPGAFPDYADQSDLYLAVNIADTGDGNVALYGSLSSTTLGTLNVGGYIVGWNIPPPLDVYVGMLPREAMASLRPYLFSYFNR